MGSHDLLMVAGEASGDQHGARLLSALKGLAPDVRAFGLGGDELVAAGLEPLAHSSEIAVVGITEALKILRRAKQIFDALVAEAQRRQAQTAVLIDAPDFNLRLARALSRKGIRVVYYISPQLWAWRQGRVRTVKKYVDKMLVVFPFEVDFYKRHGVEAVFVGHPLIDEIPVLPQAWDKERGDAPFTVALLPGSRNSEIERMLPTLLTAAARLGELVPTRFLLIKAPTISQDTLQPYLAASEVAVEVVEEDRFRVIADSHLALCASGTATLEVGLLGTPMVVIYRISAWSYQLARRLANFTYASMVNLLLEREAVPELIQDAAQPEAISRVAAELLTDPSRIEATRRSLGELRACLRDPGGGATDDASASYRAAVEVERFLVSHPAD